jgi:hypothetical protein
MLSERYFSYEEIRSSFHRVAAIHRAQRAAGALTVTVMPVPHIAMRGAVALADSCIVC